MSIATVRSKIRQGTSVASTALRVILLPVTLLGWAMDDTMRTLAAAIVFATTSDDNRKGQAVQAPRLR
jgi:hypothetical protein